jgi:hypothetical protein
MPHPTREHRPLMTLIKQIRMLLALVMVLVSCSSSAADYYVDITNNTGYTIFYIYVSPDKSDSWEDDVLGKKVLPNGQSRRINLYGYKNPVFDIRLVDEDGDSYTFWDIDVSEDDIIATLADLDSN